MRDLFWLTEKQLALIDPFFPLARGVPRVDDRRVVSGIILVIKNGHLEERGFGAIIATNVCPQAYFGMILVRISGGFRCIIKSSWIQ